MTYVFVGIVLALVAFVVYITRAWNTAQIEKATSDESQKVALEKLQLLEKERLATEYARRDQERKEEQAAWEETDRSSPGGVHFYPRVRPDSDKDDLN